MLFKKESYTLICPATYSGAFVKLVNRRHNCRATEQRPCNLHGDPLVDAVITLLHHGVTVPDLCVRIIDLRQGFYDYANDWQVEGGQPRFDVRVSVPRIQVMVVEKVTHNIDGLVVDERIAEDRKVRIIDLLVRLLLNSILKSVSLIP